MNVVCATHIVPVHRCRRAVDALLSASRPFTGTALCIVGNRLR